MQRSRNKSDFKTAINRHFNTLSSKKADKIEMEFQDYYCQRSNITDCKNSCQPLNIPQNHVEKEDSFYSLRADVHQCQLSSLFFAA